MVFTLVLALGELFSAETRQMVGRNAAAAPVVDLSPTAPTDQAPLNQLHNPRTGVTCTMRVLRAQPVDPDVLAPAPEESVDPAIRGRRVSPCLD